MAYSFTYTEKGKNIYKRRKETVERSFADFKELHGLLYCKMRGFLRYRAVLAHCRRPKYKENSLPVLGGHILHFSCFFRPLLKNTKPIICLW